MKFYMQIKPTVKSVEIPDELIYSLLSQDTGLDLDEIKLIESGQASGQGYIDFRSGFICGIREALKLIHNKNINIE